MHACVEDSPLSVTVRAMLRGLDIITMATKEATGLSPFLISCKFCMLVFRATGEQKGHNMAMMTPGVLLS
jgi:hypothetical protein